MEANLQIQARVLTFLPIVHFSPACCIHLERYLDGTEYDTLFVELPSEGQKYLPALLSKEMKPPISLLFQTEDESRILPIVSYSPEYAACKKAAEMGKKIVFVDSAAFVRGESTAQRASLRASSFTAASDFFEQAVEMNYRLSTDEFFGQVDALGRTYEHGITDRERHMAASIKAHGYGRGLAVLGAAHCPNVSAAMSEDVQAEGLSCESYLIPYIPDDYPLYGYGFYNNLHAAMKQGEDAFVSCAVRFLSAVSFRVSKEYSFEQIPMTDVINTVVHAKMLAGFRSKREIGCAELKESALSIIAKGDEASVRYSVLCKAMDETESGELPQQYDTPLLRDYRRLLKEHSIKTETGVRTVLEVLSKREHRHKSAFFRRLSYLGVSLAEMVSGADYVSGRQKNLTRETWKIVAPKKAEGQIIRMSHLGTSIDEVVRQALCESIESAALSDAPALAGYYMNAYLMETDETPAFARLSEGVNHINDFCAAVKALGRLSYLTEIKKVFDGSRSARDVDLAKQLYLKAIGLLPSIGQSEDGEEETEHLAMLNNLLTVCDYLDGELLVGQLTQLYAFGNPCVYGGVCALRVKYAQADAYDKIANYLAAEMDSVTVVLFLLGCGKTNRGIMTDIRLLSDTAAFVERLSLNEFLECAPCLRYAFAPLNRSEKAKVAQFVSSCYGETNRPLQMNEDLLLKDEYLSRQLALYGLEIK